jgi:hypothetical protein
MTGLVVVIGLVVTAFLVAAFAGGKSGYGIVSGAEFLLAGALIGPRALALVDEEMVAAVQPAMSLVVTFCGLLLGLRLRAGNFRELGVRGALAVAFEAGGTTGVVALGLPALATLFDRPEPPPLEVWALALVAAPSTKSIFAWARARLGAQGPVTDWLELITKHDDLLSLGGVLLLVTLAPPPSLAAPLVAFPGGAALACFAFGVVLSSAFTLLGGRDVDRDTAWVLLTGLTLLGAGVATRLGLPAIVVGFLIGAGITAGTREHQLLDEIYAQTKQPVVLLLLMLVGTRLTLDGSIPVVVAVLALRFAAKLATGPLLGGGGAGAGVGLFGFGGMAVAVAAQVELLYGRAAGPVLTVAAVLAIVGDVLGSIGLRALLKRAGEIA